MIEIEKTERDKKSLNVKRKKGKKKISTSVNLVHSRFYDELKLAEVEEIHIEFVKLVQEITRQGEKFYKNPNYEELKHYKSMVKEFLKYVTDRMFSLEHYTGGKWKQKTEVTLRDRLNQETGELFSVLCIGPAGENMVRYANATVEFIHSASKLGCGAVMGSKNLKAIAVRGTKGPLYADHGKVWEVFRACATSPVTKAFRLNYSRWGVSTSMPGLLRHAAEGVKNSHFGYHEVVEQSDPHAHEMKYHIWTVGCPGCAAACKVPFFKNSPRGVFGGEFRHDNTGGFNANIMLGYEEMTEISALIDELGMDGEELGGIVAWAMDLYEHGIITKEDLGGIDLQWGSVEATCELLKKIAYRENLGDVLADGFKIAIPSIGKGCGRYAWQVHGCSCATYDLRGLPDHALSYASSHTGARMGTGLGSQITESATICNFTASPARAIWGSREECARQYLNAVCGWDLTIEDIRKIALRNFIFERCYSLREGYLPSKDDKIPDRAFDLPITNKDGETYSLDREWFETALKSYYVVVFQLTEEGLPSQEILTKLGLDFVVPVLKPMGVLM